MGARGDASASRSDNRNLDAARGAESGRSARDL